MDAIILKKSWQEYVRHYRVALAFAFMLVPAGIALLLSGRATFASAGTVFFEISPSQGVLFGALSWIIMLATLLLLSFLVTIMVFAVRRDLSKATLKYDIREAVRRNTLSVFEFYVFVAFVLAVVGMLLTILSPSFLALVLFAFVSLFLFVLFLFVPQAVVIDELGVRQAMLESVNFLKRQPKAALQVVVVAALMLAFGTLMEYLLDVLDVALLAGTMLNILYITIFVLPFTECMKSFIYMLKYDLIRKTELMAPHSA